MVSGNVAYFYQIGADPVVSVYMHSLISCTIITALYMSVYVMICACFSAVFRTYKLMPINSLYTCAINGLHKCQL